MASVFDVESLEILGLDDLAIGPINIDTVSVVEIPTAATPTTMELVDRGIQGPKGDQNVYTGSVAPSNPQIGWIWIKT